MGRGSYRASDWAALRTSRRLSVDSTAVQIFDSKDAKESNKSNLIGFRESRDNPDSPESTPVIIGFDVTASMGYLAKEIATNSLNNMITTILDNKAVTNPRYSALLLEMLRVISILCRSRSSNLISEW